MREEQALLAQDYALETARAEGGFVMLANLVRQHLLTAEVASEQVWMTVSEVAELMKDYPAKTRFASHGWSFSGINPLPSNQSEL